METSVFKAAAKYNLTRKNLILVMIGSLGLLLHIVGIMSLHWIECTEPWIINDNVSFSSPQHWIPAANLYQDYFLLAFIDIICEV